jgi:hypothetical protein
LGITRFLGARTEGDDYRRVIPLMNVTAALSSGMWVQTGVLVRTSEARRARGNDRHSSRFAVRSARECRTLGDTRWRQ